jgi:hypothetical protein
MSWPYRCCFNHPRRITRPRLRLYPKINLISESSSASSLFIQNRRSHKSRWGSQLENPSPSWSQSSTRPTAPGTWKSTKRRTSRTQTGSPTIKGCMSLQIRSRITRLPLSRGGWTLLTLCCIWRSRTPMRSSLIMFWDMERSHYRREISA